MNLTIKSFKFNVCNITILKTPSQGGNFSKEHYRFGKTLNFMFD